jgi:hypothetical protein
MATSRFASLDGKFSNISMAIIAAISTVAYAPCALAQNGTYRDMPWTEQLFLVNDGKFPLGLLAIIGTAVLSVSADCACGAAGMRPVSTSPSRLPRQ